jgi:26S proteasome regulatory subunit (ATPase 3-interacting protein)
MEGKLVSLRSGASVISPEEVAKVEKDFSRLLDVWARRKRIFRDLWDAVSENLDAKQADMFEEMGVETDEAIGEVLSVYQKLLSQSKRPRK